MTREDVNAWAAELYPGVPFDQIYPDSTDTED